MALGGVLDSSRSDTQCWHLVIPPLEQSQCIGFAQHQAIGLAVQEVKPGFLGLDLTGCARSS